MKSRSLFSCLLMFLAVSVFGQAAKEKVIATIDQSEEVISPDKLKVQTGVSSRGMLTSIAGGSISLAAEGIKKLIEMDKAKYTAQYTAALNEMYFYRNLSTESALDPNGIQFDGIRVARLSAPQGKASDTAVYVSLKLDKDNIYEIVNNSNFHLKLNDFRLNAPKCKVPKGKTTMNLDIEVAIQSSWMTEGGVFYDKIELGKFYYTLRDLPLDPVKQKEFIQRLVNEPKLARLDGRSMLVPRSFGYYIDKSPTNNKFTQCWGQGAYSVTFNIRESSKQNFITKIIQDNSGAISDGIKQIKIK